MSILRRERGFTRTKSPPGPPPNWWIWGPDTLDTASTAFGTSF